MQKPKVKHIKASFAQETNMKPMQKATEHNDPPVNPQEVIRNRLLQAEQTPNMDF